MKKLKALSIVAPACERIISGQKKLEIRSWRPEHLPLCDLVIVQNTQFLHKDGDEQIGTAMAIIDIVAVHTWRKDEIEIMCKLLDRRILGLGNYQCASACTWHSVHGKT